MNKQEEIFLTQKQLNILSQLEQVDLSQLFPTTEEVIEKLSRIGKLIDWININILDKSTKLWLHILEIIGIGTIVVILLWGRSGLDLILQAKTELDLQKARLYIDSITQIAPSIAGMVATICGAIPAIIGVLRSLGKKWTNEKNEVNETSGEES